MAEKLNTLYYALGLDDTIFRTKLTEAQYEKGSEDYKAWVDVRKNYHWVMDRILEKMP